MNKQSNISLPIWETREKVQDGLSSIYSKDDVLGILNYLEDKMPTPTNVGNIPKSMVMAIMEMTLRYASAQMQGADLDNGREYFDTESAEFSLYDKEIQLDSVDVAWDKIKYEFQSFIDEHSELWIKDIVENDIPAMLTMFDDVSEGDNQKEQYDEQ